MEILFQFRLSKVRKVTRVIIMAFKIAINAGLMELEQVPEVYRNDVEEILKGE